MNSHIVGFDKLVEKLNLLHLFKIIFSRINCFISQIPDLSTHNGPLSGFDVDYRIAAYQSGSYTTQTARGGTTTQTTIDGLLMFTEYEYRVRAVNSAGSGPFSSPMKVTTGEGGKHFPNLFCVY